MRTGSEYRESLRDGRDVWVMGEGPVEDVTTHPATSAMVLEYERYWNMKNGMTAISTLFGKVVC